MYRLVKRAMDIGVSVLLLPLFLLLWAGVATAIKLDDGGPVFFHAARIGRGGKRFDMLKFRSMKVNSENILNEDGSTYNAKNDPRVTRTGRFLRETSLDEVPQILNVLAGDMSLIGPRASGWEALESYQDDEMDKMKVRPGINGYTQAYFRNGLSVREKRIKDAWYANHVGFLLDMRILLRTVATVLRRENLYTNGPESQKN